MLNRAPILYLNVLVIATCGLVYELIAGTLASYVLGDSVTQFSTCIGVYLSALGVGSWLSRFVGKGVAKAFIEIEYAVALLGGLSAPLLFVCFAKVEHFSVVLYSVVFGIGTLVGLELPLLMRILKDHLDFKDLISRVLTFDYIGALAGSLLFPILLVPKLGLVRTSILFGILNVLVGLWGTWILSPLLEKRRKTQWLRVRGIAVAMLLVAALVKADSFTSFAEDQIFTNPVVYSETSPYQRIVVTQSGNRFQLFLNGNLQFDSVDEYRYHESLVHPAMEVADGAKNVLILGGGDGLAMREVLRHRTVEHVTLVDLDPAMTGLSSAFPPLARLNQNALTDSRVNVINDDAMLWIEKVDRLFDCIIIDFPDPNNFSLGKLYTSRFYRLLANHLAPDGAIGIQCTSPLYARNSYWCIIGTMEAAGFQVHPYQVTVPTFGVWGFALAKKNDFAPPEQVMPNLSYLNEQSLAALFAFPKDMERVPTDVNRLDNQALVHYYDNAWEALR